MKMPSRSIDLISKRKKKEEKFARAGHFLNTPFLSFFAVVLHDYNAVLYD